MIATTVGGTSTTFGESMLTRCILVLLVAALLALPARAEEITLTVRADTAAGTLPTF
jgi:hypothetical protein